MSSRSGAHQFGNASDDLSFDLELAATRDFVGSLIAGGSTWKYRDTGISPTMEWTTTAYNDSAWLSGFARLGYGGDGRPPPSGMEAIRRIAIAPPGSGTPSMSPTRRSLTRCASSYSATMAPLSI